MQSQTDLEKLVQQITQENQNLRRELYFFKQNTQGDFMSRLRKFQDLGYTGEEIIDQMEEWFFQELLKSYQPLFSHSPAKDI